MAKLKSQARPKPKKLSSLEAEFIKQATARALHFEFEPETFTYVIVSKYTPDFKIKKGTWVETKGFFDKDDRRKMRAFKQQHPEIKIYLLFGNSNNKIAKKSKTTYGEWATKNGYEWADIRHGFPVKWWPKKKGLDFNEDPSA